MSQSRQIRILRHLRVICLSAIALTAAACASGGGGGGGGFTPDPTPTPPTPPSPPTSEPEDFETPEYFNGEGLAIIGASSAYAEGATGEGITIAVIDTGTDASHPDLQGQILTASFDVNADQRAADDVDENGHGTLVSGILVALKDDQGVHGVAFESSVLDIRADTPGSCQEPGEDGDDGCSFSDDSLVKAINAAVAQGVDIINLSLGGEIDADQSLENAVRDAAAAGVLVVISAGNEARPAGPDPDNPGGTLPAQGTRPSEPAYIAGQAASLGMVVAVGSINLDRELSDFSNRAGSAAQNFYILAPGEDVVTTGPDGDTPPDGQGDYYFVSGTSFAAPYVSGALALMLQSFPNLAPETALQILLDTADDYIDNTPDPVTGQTAGAGVDPVSGVGILNLAEAFAPQGQGTSSFGARQVELGTMLSAPSGAFGDWAEASGAFNGVLFQDIYGRGFTIEDAQLAAPGTVMSSLEQRALWAMGESHSVSAGNLSLSWNRPALAPDPTVPYEREPETLYTARLGFKGGLVEFGRGGRLPSIAPRASLTEEPGSPSALGGNGEWARITRDIGRFSFDAFSSDNDWQDVTGFGLSRYGHGWVSRLSFASIEHGRSALGSSLQSRFGGEDRTALDAWTLEGAARPAGWLKLSAGFEAAAVSLPDVDASNVWTSRWSLGAEAPVKGGSLSLIMAQPRRAESGTLRFDAPVLIAEDGALLYDTVSAGLTPSGRQMNYEARWQFNISSRVFGSAAAAIATQPNHIADAEAEQSLWIGIGGDL